MSKEKQLVKNTAILSMGKLVSHLCTFLTVPLYTMYLSPAAYGVLDFVLTYTALALPFMTLRLEAAVFYYITQERQAGGRHAEYVGYALRKTTMLTSLLFVFLLVVAGITGLRYFLYVATLIVLNAWNTVLLESIRAQGKNGAYTAIHSIAGILLLLSTWVFVAEFSLGVDGAFSALIIAQLTVLIAAISKLSLPIFSGLSTRERVDKKMLKFSIPLVISSSAWWVINAFDRTIITLMLGSAANGIYAVSSKFAAVLMVLFPIFGMALTESAILHINSKDKDVFFSRVFNAAIKISISLAVLLISAAGLFLPHMVGPEYLEAGLYIPILVAAMLFNNVTGLYSAIYVAKKMTKEIMNMSFMAAIANLAINLLLIGVIGIYAAAISTLVAYALMAVWRHFQIVKIIKIQYRLRDLFIAIVGFGAVCVLYYINQPIWHGFNIVLATALSVYLNRKYLEDIYKKIHSIVLR